MTVGGSWERSAGSMGSGLSASMAASGSIRAKYKASTMMRATTESEERRPTNRAFTLSVTMEFWAAGSRVVEDSSGPY